MMIQEKLWVLNFGDKCDVFADKKKKMDTRLFCVSVGVGERLTVCFCVSTIRDDTAPVSATLVIPLKL